jgi:thiosulfate/3-mercaptopyruvate sulfurtransferase
MVLRSLGFRTVRVFEESWLGYGDDMTAPAESVQYFNINSLNGRVKSLEARVRSLDADLKALKAAQH